MLEHAPGVTRRSRQTVNDAARQATSLSTSVQPREAHHSEDGRSEYYSEALRRDSSRAFPPSRDGTHLTDGTTAESLTPQVHYHSLRGSIDHQPRSKSGKAQEPLQETSGHKDDVFHGSLYRAFESSLDFYSSRVESVKTPLPDLPGTLKTEIIRLSKDKDQQWPVVIRVSDYAVGNLINGVVTSSGPEHNHLVACLMRCHGTRKQKWSLRLAASGGLQSSDDAQKKTSKSEDHHMIMHYLASMVRDAQASSVPADRAPAHQLVEHALVEINSSQSKQSNCRGQRKSQSHDTSNPEKRLRISSREDGHIAPVDLHNSQPATILPRQYQFYHGVERHYAMLEKQLDDEWPHRLEGMM
ncbi:hypothetical protein KC343_g5271 [Hortaea werneckii]|nr:hypothetical protein KC323_g7605 [Hortaea werneckii]KAI6859611.1 hypothetical protein KC338_g7261 [Hortaea werneckii]KAI7251663.1 hypothetical protein KC352_g12539 [Hortaea werneckii]KAI7354876.1 hypothetical protein KC320_g3139 [Hortaea werneckii]KAI7572956.1 hypothetical protein KC317_g302 [Hortaea werneckii]